MKILVFDFGGGTLDVTIMEFGEGVFEVKATSGDTQLGGTNMDEALIDFLVKEFKKMEGIDLSKDKVAMQRLKEAAEKAKIELSSVLETELNLPFISATNEGPKHFQFTLRRAKLEELVTPIIERCKGPVEQALKDSKLKPADIDKIIMVGGPTRMPIVQKFVEDMVSRKVERGVDAMECVAMGAAIQGGVLAGEVKDILLLDVTPLSLGIETLGGIFTKLIERNTTIPVKKSQVFSTAADNQTAVTIRVFQGERPMASDNKLLGQFDLIGIPSAPRGIPQVEVAFDIDANGIVHVSAKDLGTGKQQSIVITAEQKLNEADINRMRKEAEMHAEEDLKRKEEVETINQADTTLYTTEKSLKEMEGKVAPEKLESAKKALEELRAALKKKDVQDIKTKMESLMQAAGAAATELYQKTGKSNEEPAGEAKKGRKGKVMDADYKVEDEK